MRFFREHEFHEFHEPKVSPVYAVQIILGNDMAVDLIQESSSYPLPAYAVLPLS
jgi:hypothetical protein